MAEDPWLTIIGLGEDGPDGLSPASAKALTEAEIIMGPPRHLSLIGETGAEAIEWPVPFVDGVERLLSLRGRRVTVLASGDPFWFGAGSTITKHLKSSEWRAFPGQSCFSLAAAALGWPLQQIICLGLHAAPLARMRPHLAAGVRLIVTLRDGAAVSGLADYLIELGFDETEMHVLEALGGPRQRCISFKACNFAQGDFAHPLCVALEVEGEGVVLTRASGRSDAIFETDGQITKRPIRALTLSTLAPKPHEMLWDIGGGSGSIALEWLLCDPTTRAVAIEARDDRAERIKGNAEKLGQDRLQVVQGRAPDALKNLPKPDAVFIGGGLSDALLEHLSQALSAGTRLVANAVTLESEAMLPSWQARLGGDLMRIELSQAGPLGPRRGWKSSYPVVQWSVTL